MKNSFFSKKRSQAEVITTVLLILVGIIIALTFGASISDIKEKANYFINKRKDKKTNL